MRLLAAVLCLGVTGFGGLLDGLQTTTTESARLANLETEVQQLKTSLAQASAQIAALSTPTVAFSAGLSKTIENAGSHQIIVFDHVITNVGGAYNPLAGHFTAPVSGVYAFYVVLTNMPLHSASVDLLKNGAYVGHLLAHGQPSDGGDHNTSTLAISLQLQQGDSVWVQNEWSYSDVEKIDGSDWSLFSGHLIK